jgi:hypothetical protein
MRAYSVRKPLSTLIALASIATPVFAADSDPFATEIEGANPVLWREYEPLNQDFVRCLAGREPGRLTKSVCSQLAERRGRMLFDALKQAVWLNIVSPEKRGFCAEHATKIVLDQDVIEGGTIAAYMIDFQLHGGTGSYGANLPQTYLGKIVNDALLKISPCKP